MTGITTLLLQEHWPWSSNYVKSQQSEGEKAKSWHGNSRWLPGVAGGEGIIGFQTCPNWLWIKWVLVCGILEDGVQHC